MTPNPETSIRETLARLRKTETALTGKARNQPVIVYRHRRWHMLKIGFVIDAEMEARQGISTVHFLSRYRARKTIKEWLPYSELTPFEAVCPAFQDELMTKVLPEAEDYRPLLQNGQVVLAGGYTTDTLQALDNDLDQRVASIAEWMQTGPMGPFLHFERSYQLIQA